jgi:inner membrane protein involved in colicin E2 resistance
MENSKSLKFSTFVYFTFLIAILVVNITIYSEIKQNFIQKNSTIINKNSACECDFKSFLLNTSEPSSYINKVTKPFLIELVKNATKYKYENKLHINGTKFNYEHKFPENLTKPF